MPAHRAEPLDVTNTPDVLTEEAYCRGPYCVLSFEADASLRAKDYKVRRLEDGFPEWKAAGLEIEAVA